MQTLKVAIGRGIYEIPLSNSLSQQQIKSISSELNSKVNSIISESNIKNQPNDLLILIAAIEIISKNNHQLSGQNKYEESSKIENNFNTQVNHQINGQVITTQEEIDEEINRSVVAHLKSLLIAIQSSVKT
jgi:hypothetical protein